MSSKYPRFHRYVNRAYIGLLLILAIVLPLCYLFTDAELSISGIIIIFIAVLMSYAIYWLTVRTNCYGERTDQPTTPEMVITPTAQHNDSSAQSAHSRGSSNSHVSTNPPYPTFTSYRLGDMRDRLRRWASNNGARSEDEEVETTATEEVANPPPTYSVALEGAGLPPPYTTGSDTNESVTIVVDDGSNNNTSRRTASVSSTSSSPRSPTSWLFGLTPFKSTTSPSSQRGSPTNLLVPPPAFTSGSTPVPQATPTQPSTQTSQSNSQSDRIPPPRRAPPSPPQSQNNQSPS
ncbi:2546_t:CDS:2 [Paraglomus brasilianum]|uniref:2546_t:CDS:1 n=1 Tax=Paraglomus brasilianum TaxID=144538 RepID=A0A9N9C9T7_9GLOM|nr:2546_t:CDS:2 [Paraglomus brasilianum]